MKKMLLSLAAVLAVGSAMAAENVIHSFPFTKANEFSAWGSKKFYTGQKVTVADGVAKLTVGEVIGTPKTGFQIMVLYRQGFKKGVTYKITGTIKSSQAVRANVCVQLSGAPFTAFFQTSKSKWTAVSLKPGEAQNFTVEFTAPEDITSICRAPGIHTGPLKPGTVVECSNVKVIEVLK